MAGPGRPKTGGRAPGTPNKTTSASRDAIAAFVDGNADRLNGWLDEIYEKNGPRAAFECFSDLLEYHVPKLTRSEVKAEVDVAGEVGIRPQLSREEWLALHKVK
jgi:hypothetical protein